MNCCCGVTITIAAARLRWGWRVKCNRYRINSVGLSRSDEVARGGR